MFDSETFSALASPKRLQVLEWGLGRLLREHPCLVRVRRVADRHPHREPVELRLRQRVGALVLHGILRRDHEERPLEDVRRAVDRHLRLLHRLEQRGLCLRGGAVDLVDEQDVREHRAGTEPERPRGPIEDVDARHVGRQQVGRELHALEPELE